MRKSKYVKILTTALNRNQSDYQEHLLIKEALKPLDGDIIGKRDKKYLPDGWSLCFRIGMVHAVNDKTENRHLLTHSEPFNYANFVNKDAPYGRGAIDRINKLEAILNDPDKLDRMVIAFNKLERLYKQMKAICTDLYGGEFGSFENPSYYEIKTEMDIQPPELISIIRSGRK